MFDGIFILPCVSDLRDLENYTLHGSPKIPAGGRILVESSGRGTTKDHIGGTGEKGIGISLHLIISLTSTFSLMPIHLNSRVAYSSTSG